MYRVVVVGIDNIQIRHRLKSPLQSAIKVGIIDLSVVLRKGCEENVFCKTQFNFWSYQSDISIFVWFWQNNFILRKTHTKNSPRLLPEIKVS